MRESAGADASDDIVIGTGDDAAVLAARPTVLSVDTAVQDRHFRLDWSTPAQVGARSVIASAADVAAMGARLSGVLVSIAMPPSTPVTVLLELNDGIIAQTHELGGRVLGGDLVSASEIAVSVTSVGVLVDEPVTLSGARPGDVLAVSGALGGAAAGYAVLDAGLDERQFAGVVAAFRVPRPDLTQGVAAASVGAHAMTDISDGLVEELITMSTASGVCLDVSSELVPIAAGVSEVATARSDDSLARRWALVGGEDHCLLAAFATEVPQGWTVIGSVRASLCGEGAVLIDGAEPSSLSGWQSF